MTFPNRARACTKAKLLAIACMLGLIVNFLMLNYHSLTFARQLLWISTVADSNVKIPELETRELISYTQKHAVNMDNGKTELVSSISRELNILANGNLGSLKVLRDLVLNLRNRQDSARFRGTIEHGNLTGQNYQLVNWTEIWNTTEVIKPRCLLQPPGLFGPVTSNLASVFPAGLEKNYAILKGGHYSPEECLAFEKLAIIIPYRNRNGHLHILLNNLLPILIRQQLDFRIYIIEQAMPATFNRGMLLNIGYQQALKVDHYDCFIFHDVDMIPLNDNCLYRCSEHPRHLTSAISKWKYGLPYKSYLGGVVAFTREQFRNINGCSNLYFGWGGEDDDLRVRIKTFGYKILRYPKVIGRYDTIVHLPDQGNSPNPDRFGLIEYTRQKMISEGLNTTLYNVTSIEYKTLYTWIHVRINMDEVLQPSQEQENYIKKHKKQHGAPIRVTY